MSCPCGGASRAECCGPLVDGVAEAKTALALMRSRYTAYAEGRVDHLIRTHRGGTERDRPAIAAFAARTEFLGLEILRVEAGGERDERGVVEFVARLREEGRPGLLHERSSFERREGRWLYVQGEFPERAKRGRGMASENRGLRGPEEFPGEAREVGRNAPCPCGSGKKAKRCCAAQGARS